jgi:glutathione peroxidase
LALFLLRYLCTPSRPVTVRVKQDVYAHMFKTLEGHLLPLDLCRGEVVLIVNTASECGFTHQYAGLQALYEKYKDRGFLVLGVPSNDFGRQEPGSSEEIKTFCETRFHVTFPLSEKVEVKGDNAHPFFRQVRRELGYWARPHWNFYKYLIGRDGVIVNWYSCRTAPDANALVRAVETELAK